MEFLSLVVEGTAALFSICPDVAVTTAILKLYAVVAELPMSFGPFPGIEQTLRALVVRVGPIITHTLLQGVAHTLPVIDAVAEPMGRTFLALTEAVPAATWHAWFGASLTRLAPPAWGAVPPGPEAAVAWATARAAAIGRDRARSGAWLRPWRELLLLLARVWRGAAPVAALAESLDSP